MLINPIAKFSFLIAMKELVQELDQQVYDAYNSHLWSRDQFVHNVHMYNAECAPLLKFHNHVYRKMSVITIPH